MQFKTFQGTKGEIYQKGCHHGCLLTGRALYDQTPTKWPKGWPTGPTLAPNDLRLGDYIVYETTTWNLWSLSQFAQKTWPAGHVVAARLSTSTKPSQPSWWNWPSDPLKPPFTPFCHTHTHHLVGFYL
jgi:hypothetical protein